jgi:hypothetical protein
MKRTIILYLSILLSFQGAFAEENQKIKDRETRKEKKEERIRNKWARLIPKQNKLQFAGSMGMFSGSVGWYYGKKNQWETDLFLGFIPKMNRQNGHMTITLKETYTPWHLQLNDDFSYEPLTTGIYVNKIFGEYFWSKLPERYPDGYYFWAINTRFNVFVGQAITVKLNKSPLFGKELSFYYEFSTNDLYILSAIGNKTIHAWDIIGLSLGIRYRAF